MDRNPCGLCDLLTTTLSLSARRAWIEIAACGSAPSANGVALRKESVDRNIASIHIQSRYELSLSARRAWIEIDRTEMQPGAAPSLSARRAWIEIAGPV